jgi:hypothetical protein
VLSAADTFDDTILDKAPKGGRSKSGTSIIVEVRIAEWGF